MITIYSKKNTNIFLFYIKCSGNDNIHVFINSIYSVCILQPGGPVKALSPTPWL